jgi:hypothetical protein
MIVEVKMSMKGNEGLKKKFEETVKNNPQIHMELLNSFGSAMVLAFNLKKEDEITVNSFRLAEVISEEILENKKTVDS